MQIVLFTVFFFATLCAAAEPDWGDDGSKGKVQPHVDKFLTVVKTHDKNALDKWIASFFWFNLCSGVDLKKNEAIDWLVKQPDTLKLTVTTSKWSTYPEEGFVNFYLHFDGISKPFRGLMTGTIKDDGSFFFRTGAIPVCK